jgi:hypothetical protein
MPNGSLLFLRGISHEVFNVHSILFSSQPILHPSIVVVSLACLLCQLSLWSKAIGTTDSLETRLRLNCIVCNGYLHLLRFDGQPPIAEVKVACLLQRMGVQRVLCHTTGPKSAPVGRQVRGYADVMHATAPKHASTVLVPRVSDHVAPPSRRSM